MKTWDKCIFLAFSVTTFGFFSLQIRNQRPSKYREVENGDAVTNGLKSSSRLKYTGIVVLLQLAKTSMMWNLSVFEVSCDSAIMTKHAALTQINKFWYLYSVSKCVWFEQITHAHCARTALCSATTLYILIPFKRMHKIVTSSWICCYHRMRMITFVARSFLEKKQAHKFKPTQSVGGSIPDCDSATVYKQLLPCDIYGDHWFSNGVAPTQNSIKFMKSGTLCIGLYFVEFRILHE